MEKCLHVFFDKASLIPLRSTEAEPAISWSRIFFQFRQYQVCNLILFEETVANFISGIIFFYWPNCNAIETIDFYLPSLILLGISAAVHFFIILSNINFYFKFQTNFIFRYCSSRLNKAVTRFLIATAP